MTRRRLPWLLLHHFDASKFWMAGTHNTHAYITRSAAAALLNATGQQKVNVALVKGLCLIGIVFQQLIFA